MLLEHRSKGYSFKSFAAVCKPPVCIATLYNWTQEYPEFLDAMNQGYPAALHWWETQANEGLHNQVIKTDDGMTVNKSVNAAVLKFQMSNLFPDDYRERREVAQAPPPDAGDQAKRIEELTAWLTKLSSTP